MTGYYDVDRGEYSNSLQSHMYPAYTQTFDILYLFYVNPAAFCWLNNKQIIPKGQPRHSSPHGIIDVAKHLYDTRMNWDAKLWQHDICAKVKCQID